MRPVTFLNLPEAEKASSWFLSTRRRRQGVGIDVPDGARKVGRWLGVPQESPTLDNPWTPLPVVVIPDITCALPDGYKRGTVTSLYLPESQSAGQFLSVPFARQEKGGKGGLQFQRSHQEADFGGMTRRGWE